VLAVFPVPEHAGTENKKTGGGSADPPPTSLFTMTGV